MACASLMHLLLLCQFTDSIQKTRSHRGKDTLWLARDFPDNLGVLKDSVGRPQRKTTSERAAKCVRRLASREGADEAQGITEGMGTLGRRIGSVEKWTLR
ncbi:hypothetical protein CDAR_316181 [Caerostris darwini]|uniref:Secreted protein n=1 Tax=Caerostris darwini TaxID=1538125 RepID=A0AAV4QBZ9_9ARAC|nr:hypothetical protein CDAR_316181 [Caerostris darwini]